MPYLQHTTWTKLDFWINSFQWEHWQCTNSILQTAVRKHEFMDKTMLDDCCCYINIHGLQCVNSLVGMHILKTHVQFSLCAVKMSMLISPSGLSNIYFVQLISHCLKDIFDTGTLVSSARCMNKLNPHQARLVPQWVTVFGRVYHLGMQPAN